MTPTRVLIVDDSVVVRRLLSDIVSAHTDLEVAGTAATAPIGLQKLSQTPADVVLLDVEMPEMDGIEAVRRIRATYPKLPVIMCSSLTERGADVTLKALAAGASDYIAKPGATGGGLDGFRNELVAKVRALSGRAVSLPPAPRPSLPAPAASLPRIIAARRTSAQPFTVLAIGCSTGGPNALARLFQDLPGDLPVPILITQHMPPLFTRLLAERLTASSRVKTFEAHDGMVVEAGKAYIAPGDWHMVAQREGAAVKLQLHQGPFENSCRPAVDVMFRSVAQVWGSGVLATVLTGMGHDGTQGARAIVAAGGLLVVQSPEDCVVGSMPKSVLAAGAADSSLPIDQLGPHLVSKLRASAVRTLQAQSG